MSFYHLKPDITLGHINTTCNLKDFEFDQKIVLNSFIKSSIASKNDITFYNNQKYNSVTHADTIITTERLAKNFDHSKKILISKNIDLDIAKLSNLFYRDKNYDEILSLNNSIIGENSIISNKSFIDRGCVIGSKFELDHYSSIGHSCIIGNNVTIGKNVSITNAIIGDNVTISDGSKIGQPGFGFVYDNKKIVKIYHIGRVIIQNDVNIGSNCTIDRGSFSDTFIGESTNIDNLVHIAHNVSIGNCCVIAGQCGFAGSAEIGNFVHIGGQTGIAGHIKISDNARIAAKSGIIRDIHIGETVMGYPAISVSKYLKNYKKTMIDS